MKKWMRKTPNIMTYIEMDEAGIHLHYPKRSPWTLYAGEHVLYRQKTTMQCERNAWEPKAEVFRQLLEQLDVYLKNPEGQRYLLLAGDKPVSFCYEEAYFLKGELTSIYQRLLQTDNQLTGQAVVQQADRTK